ncbi:MAG: ribosome recycling factor [Chloroflexi bacterium]|nr:ribosome recycling factor [Chloroflexota bacterium]
MDDILKASEERMKKALEHVRHEMVSIRTGRATPALLEPLRVDYYGTPTPISQMAQITSPDARMLVIQPWDKGMLGAIEKAIQKSELGINPTNDGNVIRLALPHPTEERRKDLVKQVHQRAEEGRVAVRNIRRDGMDQLKRVESVSEADIKRGQERLEKITSQHIHEVDEVSKQKETEVLEV